MKVKSIPSLMVLLVMAWTQCAFAQMNVTSRTPDTNESNVAASIDISVTFDDTVNDATVDADSFNVAGSQTGRRTGIYTIAGNTVTCDPDADFKPGEVVTVTLTADIQSTGGSPLAEHTWQFTVVSGFGPGTFSVAGIITATANGATNVYTADVDGDGDIDVLSASTLDDTIAWYENDGTQNFARHNITTSANNAWEVTTADVDGDGDMDVLTGSMNDNRTAWYENNGLESFTRHTVTTSDLSPRSVSATDIDGDGDMDILVASRSSNRVRWYENNGAQNFTPHTITNTAGPLSAYAADVDGDGDMDVLSASSLDDTVAWHENDGSQNFTTHDITTTANGARSVYAADVNGDGHMDVLSASNTLDWYENDGTQNFTTRTIVAGNPFKVTAADVDGDGDMDILATFQAGDTVAWYENDGAETFTTHDITTTADFARGISVADVDGDGDLDVLSASRDDDTIAWYEQTLTDFGDLPAAYAITLTADNGAIHKLPNTGRITLGAVINHETDGQESADAGGDGAGDDGIAVSAGDWIEGAGGGSLDVVVTGGSGYLTGWIDWNEDNDFGDAGEQIFDRLAVNAGAQTETFTIPAGALPVPGANTRFARFRLTPSNAVAVLTIGQVANGEVEDYQLAFTAATVAPPGNALDFDGMDDFVELSPHVSNIEGLNQGTISGWFKTVNTAGQNIFSISDSTANGNRIVARIGNSTSYPDESFSFLVRRGNTIRLSMLVRKGETFYADGEWHHFAIVTGGGDNRIYIDGVNEPLTFDTGNSTTGEFSNINSPDAMTVGNIKRNNSTDRYFQGQIDEIRIWNVARSEAEILGDMNNLLTGSDPNLLAYYRFDQGDVGAASDNTGLPNEVIDYSANCNGGALTGFSLTGTTGNWTGTTNDAAPILTTLAVTGITGTTADSGGNIFSVGSINAVERGIVWNITGCPTTAEPGIISETAGPYTTGSYAANMTGLLPSTTYYVRAYAVNADGVTYGETQTFTTAAPVISINDPAAVDEGAGTVTFTVSLSAVSGQDVQVTYQTNNGTATAGADYTAIGATVLTIPAGNPNGTIVVNIAEDALDEVNETFTADLSLPVNATIADNQGMGTINDNDPTPTISVNDPAAVDESAGTVIFTVSLNAVSGQNVQVTYQTNNGTATAGADYTAIGATVLTIPAGNPNGTVVVNIAEDALSEANETFTVDLSLPVNATIADNQGTGTINDNDGPDNDGNLSAAAGVAEPVALPSTANAAASAVNVFDFTLADGGTADGLPLDVTRIVIHTSGTGDFNKVEWRLNGMGAANVPGVYNGLANTITFPALGISVANGASETYTVSAFYIDNTGLTENRTYILGVDGDTDLTVGPAGTRMGATTPVNNGTGSAVSITGTRLAFGVQPSDTDAGAVIPAFTVLIQDDFGNTDADGAASVALSLNSNPGGSAISGANPVNAAAGIATFNTVSLDNPGAGYTFNAASAFFLPATSNPFNINAQPVASIDTPAAATEGTGAGTTEITFTATLSAASLQTVTVPFAGVNGSATAADYTVATASPLVFNPGVTSRQIRVNVVRDALVESAETFSITLGVPTNATLGTASGVGTINDDDVVSVDIDTPAAATEGTGAGTTEIIFTATLSAASLQTVTVPFAGVNGSATAADYTVATASPLVFNPGVTSRLIRVNVVRDALVESAETFSITLGVPTNATLGTASGVGTINDDDVPVSVSIDTPAAVTEGTGTGTTTLTFTVALSATSGLAVTAPFTVADGSATADDYGLVTASPLIFNPGETSKSVSVDIVRDALYETAETFAITLGTPTNATLGTMTGTGTITDDDVAAGLTIGPVSGDTGEDGTRAAFTVRLEGRPAGIVSINVAGLNTAEGTAGPGNLVFTEVNWDAPQTVTVTGVDDAIPDGDQTYAVRLSIDAGGTTDVSGYAALAPYDVFLTNIDNDSPGVSVGAISGNTGEDGTSATFTVRLAAPPDGTVAIGLASSNVAEGTVSPSSLTFTPSNWNADRNVTVTGADDAVKDGDRTYTIVLTIDAAGTSDSTGYAAIDPPDVRAVNVDDESPGFTVSAIDGNTSENGGQASFTIKLNAIPDGNVVVDLASSNPAEGTVFPASLTFTPANACANQIVTVTGVDDHLADGNQEYAIVLAVNPSGTTDGTGYAVLDPPDVTVVNVDNETPGITVTPESGRTAEDGSQTVFGVRLNSAPDGDVVINISGSDPTEGTAAQSSLTFTPLNWSADQTVTVTGIDDDVVDGDQWHRLLLTVDRGLTADSTGYALLDPPYATVLNLDDETPGFTISPPSGDTAEDGTTATFTVRLNAQPYADVVVDVASGDAAEGLPTPALLTFTPANWNADQIVTVTGIDDDVADGDRGYAILLTTNTGSTADADYAAIDPPDAALANADDETAGFAVSSISGNTGEDGTRATFSVRLNSEPDGDVVVTVESSDNTEGGTTPPVLVFTPANWDADQTVTAAGIDDPSADGNRTYKAILTIDSASTTDTTGYALLDPSDVSIINIDDETAGFTMSAVSGDTAEDGTTALFMLKLNSAPDGSVFVSAASSDISEGVVLSTEPLIFTPENWNVYQPVAVTGSDDDIADGNQEYTVLLAVAAGTTDAAYAILDPPDVALTNVDDETAGFTVSPIDGDTAENGMQASFSIRLNSEPEGNVVLSAASSDTGEGAVSPAFLTFSPSNWKTGRTVTVTGVDDAEADGNQGYTVVLAVDPAGTDAETYASLDPPDVDVVNIDDDFEGPGPVIVGQTELSTEAETALAVAFEHLVVEDAAGDYPLGFTLIVENGVNYTVEPFGLEALILPVTGFSGTLSVPVRVNDGVYDSNVFQLKITVADSAVFDPGFDIDGSGIPFERDIGPSSVCLNCGDEIDADKVYMGVSLAIENTNPMSGDFFTIDGNSDGDNNPETGIHVDENNVIRFNGLRIGFVGYSGEDNLEITFDSEDADGKAVGELLDAIGFDNLSDAPDERPRDLAVVFGDAPDEIEYGLTVNFIYERSCSCHFEDGKMKDAWPVGVNPADESVVQDGASVKLVASPHPASENGGHKRTHWLVRRKDRQNWDYYNASRTDLTEHAVTGLEPGLKYVWKAGYENENMEISWSPDATFKVGRTGADEKVSVAPGAGAENYAMVSFTRWPDDSTFKATLGGIMGPELDRENYRIAAFDQTRGCFTEYGCERFLVEPGRAYWFLARTGLDMEVAGVPVSLDHDFELEMRFNPYDKSGWNMIAPPNGIDYYWGDIRVVVYEDEETATQRSARNGGVTLAIAEKKIVFGPEPLSDMAYPNDIVDHRLWRPEGQNYLSGTYRLEKNKGYLARVKRRGVSLIFPAEAGITPDSARPPDPGHGMVEPDDDVTPAFPFLTAVDGSCPEVESGEPGCFIGTAAKTPDSTGKTGNHAIQ